MRAGGFFANGVFVLALAMFAKHALGQELVYAIFAIIGDVLIISGLCLLLWR